MHFGWAKSYLNPAFLMGVHGLPPPMAEESMPKLFFKWSEPLVTLITCLVEWVQLSLQGSKEKMSWYSARSN